MPAVKNVGEPCAGEPHARFEGAAGGNQASRASTCRAAQAPLAYPTNRHTFGTLAVRGAESIVELQNWLGHAEVRTTMRYTHYREQEDAAARLAAAFKSRRPQPAGEGAEQPAAEPAGDG